MKTYRRFHRIPMAVTLLLSLALLLAATLTSISCTSPTTTDTSVSTDTTQPSDAIEVAEFRLATSDLTRLPASAPRANLESVAVSTRLFGADLYALLADDAGSGNVVFSPDSILTALAMTYAGAEGVTADEIAATLRFSLQGNTLHQAVNSLDAALESRNRQQTNAEGKTEGVLLKTANSIWAQDGLLLEQPFLDTLAVDYGAGVRLVDFATEAEPARLAINKWVSDQTEDKIPDLIPQGVLDALTRMVLVNAIYMDATWAKQFDPLDTADGDFTTLAGNKISTSMMQQTETLSYAAGEDWRAVELPYVGEELGMLLILPEANTFAEVEARITTGLLDEVAGSLVSGYDVKLTMPKFRFRTQAALNVPLLTLGMTTPFDPSAANFSGMTTQEKLYISDVIHEAFIEVDEEGTEAAAATAVVMELTAAPAEAPVELTLDRPFLFAIRDRDTGAILFLGRVTDPTKE